MANKIQLKRGTRSQVLAATGAIGEPLYATDTKELFIGNGTGANTQMETTTGAQTKATQALNDAKTYADSQLDNHKTERISHLVSITRDLSLTGTQKVSTFIKPKALIINACGLNAPNKRSDGMYTEDGLQSALVVKSTGSIVKVTPAIFITNDDGTNATIGTIGNSTDTSFDIVWTKNGTGATGSAEINFMLISHY
ncbi:hypothetical protein [Paenibacillus sp.]|uniref:hyaluronate lyase N-terminal domain-containing protein n=1 Tax=Paenibacillus sp. TaxID=58172 RepID=UPI0028B0269B|nr:hypothetical protein [Paenibacillus sp.]